MIRNINMDRRNSEDKERERKGMGENKHILVNVNGLNKTTYQVFFLNAMVFPGAARLYPSFQISLFSVTDRRTPGVHPDLVKPCRIHDEIKLSEAV